MQAAQEQGLNLDFGELEPSVDDVELNLDFGAEAPEPEAALNLDFDTEPEAEVVTETPVVEEDGELDAEEQQVLDELRSRLASEVGDWYVVHTYSGMENRVKQNLENRIKALGMEDYIYEVVVPTEDVVENRNGTRKVITRTILPGYVLVRMELDDASWAAVRHTPSVTGFVAHASNPVPLSLEEVVKMLAPAALAKIQDTAKEKKRRKKVEVTDFKAGDSVMVTQGAFQGIHATITEIDLKRGRLRALVEILGRETPVDLTFNQISKID